MSFSMFNLASANHIWVATNTYGGGNVVEEFWIDDLKLSWFTEGFGDTGGLLQVKCITTVKGTSVPNGEQVKSQLLYFYGTNDRGRYVSLKDGAMLEYYFAHGEMGFWTRPGAGSNAIKCLILVTVQNGHPVFADVIVKNQYETDEKLYKIYLKAMEKLTKL